MADGLAEMRLDLAVSAERAHREQCDLVVEVDEAFDDDATVADAATGHREVPRGLHVGGAVELALAFARAAHHRLDDAGVADAAVDRRLKLGQRVGEDIRAGGQAQRFGGEAANAFAVHRQPHRARGGDHPHDTSGFEFFEHGRGNGLDLGHHEHRSLGFNQRLQLLRVAHRDGARVVRHLVAWRVLVAVDRDGLDAQALQRDQHLFAELAAAEQHDFGGVG